MTQEALQSLCEEWQERLRLQDWDVEARFLRAYDLNPGEQGNARWTLAKRIANINVMDPSDYDPQLARPQDIEVTVVHELLHLHCAPFDTFDEGTPLGTSMEQMIHALSEALVALKREPAKQMTKEAEA